MRPRQGVSSVLADEEPHAHPKTCTSPSRPSTNIGVISQVGFPGAVPLSRETGFSLWEEGRDTTVVLRDSRYDL
jgi:hypothetical protein